MTRHSALMACALFNTLHAFQVWPVACPYMWGMTKFKFTVQHPLFFVSFESNIGLIYCKNCHFNYQGICL